jgi:hypothetical protein
MAFMCTTWHPDYELLVAQVDRCCMRQQNHISDAVHLAAVVGWCSWRFNKGCSDYLPGSQQNT